MATIFALNYKNYLNRFADKEATLADYLAKDPSYFMQANVNFKLGDGVNTYQILGTNNEYNYLLVVEGDSILSRWYIMDTTYITKNQSRLTLQRDVVVDGWEALKNAPIYVDKGWVDYQDPLIFNTEGVGFNQIKKAEILLKDQYPCAWLVAYVATKLEGQEFTPIEGAAINSDTQYDIEVQGNITEWEYYKYTINANIVGPVQPLFSNTYNHLFHVYTVGDRQIGEVIKHNFNESDSVGTERIFNQDTTCESISTAQLRSKYPIYSKSINSQVNGQVSTVSTAFINNINALDGKIIRYLDGGYKYSRISVKTRTQHYKESYLSAGALYNSMKNWVEASGGTNINNKTLSFETDVTRYFIELIDITQNVSAKFTFDTSKQKLVDAPYYMVCMPYGDFTLHITEGETSYNLPQNTKFAMDLMNNFVFNGQSWIYDYQLLPYCPINGLSASGADIYVDNYTASSIMKVMSGTELKSIVFLAKYSKFSVQINMANNEAYNYLTKVETNAIERKVKSECELVRLCSPNGSNSFDFNPQMNDGFDYIQVDCTYKPYSPYIHVAPDFAGLYGDNFGDTRGLIVQGDFSLPTLTSQWKEYEINNKNYANVFNRETQSLEFQEQKRRTQAGWSVAAGVLTGAVSGATGAGLIGGPIGAGVGAVGGTAASLASGLADYHISKELYAEQMSLRSDRFNYSLDNIKARPNGLAKTSAFTNNNKIFPFLEFYTATDTEKEALRQKIRYEGMKLGVIGTISKYSHGPEPHTYFRGTLIRLENYSNDYHFINALTNELMMGIFVPLEE